MGFSLPLKSDFPENIHAQYFTHNSGGEHFSKQISDISDVQQMRMARGIGEIAELGSMMHAGGIRVVRQLLPQNGRGDIIGLGVVDCRTSDMKLYDLWVDKTHRHQGIGGYILGSLLINRDYNFFGAWETMRLGESIEIGAQKYSLPGMMVTLHTMIHGVKISDEQIEQLVTTMPRDFTGVLMTSRKNHASGEVFVKGDLVARLNHKRKVGWSVEGAEKPMSYDNAAIAAIHALNP